MVAMDVRYDGSLRCTAIHGPSGCELITDAPVDNHGKGESFSPTDLVATAAASCMLTIMGIVAQRDDIDLIGTSASVLKQMTTQPPRRIAQLDVTITFGPQVPATAYAALERAALGCPVLRSLHSDIVVNHSCSK